MYPFYKYFLFTEYITEDNIKVTNDEDYMMLAMYIKKNNYKKETTHLETLDLYNKFNNLLFETYSNKITRKVAEEEKLNQQRVYEENKILFSEFFKRIKNIDENLELKEDDVLTKFLIDKNSDESEQLIDIYKKYIEEQNNMIRDILTHKHNDNGFPISEEINVQSIEKYEIFSFKLKSTCLTEIIFESSFRKDNFRDIIVNYEEIENKLTKKLLKKVKLLNNNIKYIIYSNEKHLHENTSIFNEFDNNYKPLKSLTKQEKNQIKNYIDNKIETKDQCLNLINDFKNIVFNINKKYQTLLSEKKEENNEINGNEENKENKEYLEDKENDEKNENEEDKENIENKEDEEEKENEEIKKEKQMKIKDVIDNKKYITIEKDKFSNEFNGLLGKIGDFTFDKLIDIILFSERLMFSIIKNELIKYCSKELSQKNKDDLDAFYKDEKLITKEVLLAAIRRYLTRYLIREEDKEKNIKENERNFIKFLYIEDLWDNRINSNENQKESELKIIENMKLSINQIISVYDHLGGDNLINEEMNELKEKDEIPIKLLSINQEEIDNNIDNNIYNNSDINIDNNNDSNLTGTPAPPSDSSDSENPYANNDDDAERE